MQANKSAKKAKNRGPKNRFFSEVYLPLDSFDNITKSFRYSLTSSTTSFSAPSSESYSFIFSSCHKLWFCSTDNSFSSDFVRCFDIWRFCIFSILTLSIFFLHFLLDSVMRHERVSPTRPRREARTRRPARPRLQARPADRVECGLL